MKCIDGPKVERIIRQVYEIFEKEEVTGSESAAIAGMIILTSAVKFSCQEFGQILKDVTGVKHD